MKVLSSVVLALVIVGAAQASLEPPSGHYLPPHRQLTPYRGFRSPRGRNEGFRRTSQGSDSSHYYSYPKPGSTSYEAPDLRGSQRHQEFEWNEPAKYDFGYRVRDPRSGNDFGHQESRYGSKTRGRYHVLLPDGRRQVVVYEADEAGFRPRITYEAPGAPY
ncbi:pro-resilin-like [Copidosoma floridanum]|uniref:pro-resilin-like n=1 Tax=Copidosoma floridanum TaxID=29053 RepID=UPI0006C9CBEC|nr:pro-resilin-like [Copidosoma floridanum]